MSKTRKFDFRRGAHGPHFSKLAVAVSLVLGAMATPMAAPLQLTADQVFDWNGQTSATLDGIEANVTPVITNSKFIFDLGSGQSLTVNGDTNISLDATEIDKTSFQQGTYVFNLGSGAKLDLNGDVNIVAIHSDEQVPDIGNNVFYSFGEGSTINIGKEGGTTKAWALAEKPDLISAKNGGVVNVRSTNNQFVGSIDFIDESLGTRGSSVTAKFKGKDAYWFGDDQSFENVGSVSVTGDATATAIGSALTFIGEVDVDGSGTAEISLNKEGFDGFLELFSENLTQHIDIKTLQFNVENSLSIPADENMIQQVQGILQKLEIKLSDVLGAVGENYSNTKELELSDGAQWTYFGLDEQFNVQISNKKVTLNIPPEFGSIPIMSNIEATISEVTVNVENTNVSVSLIPKRISSITLNGGIINLYDEDIQNTWANTRATEGGKSLLDLWPALKDVKHDYVRIGKLEGNGGIFRLDLNSDDPANSDMVFVESSEKGGMHYIEPYNPQKLASVSDTKRVTFAVTSKDANNIKFADKVNIYGERLVDYELGVDSEPIDSDAVKEKIAQTVTQNYDTFTDFDINDFDGGTNWFINRLTMTQSAASVAMRSAGYASYDTAVRMDRHDRRLHDAVFQNDEKDGLWVRVQYGEAGAQHIYDADLTSVYVGYEKATSPDNRLGVSFAYTDGDTDFKDVKGSGEIKRYEASVYDTMTFGAHYVDLVARFGQVENEFDSYNAIGTLKTSGDFDQKYAAISAEYGYTLKDSHNVFIEPQLQVQAAYLDGYTYRTERDMKVKADSDVSVIGRAGVRFGKAFEGSDMKGELYARADVLHQFTDGQDAHFIDPSNRIGVTWGDTDTWSTFGVGGYMNIKDNVSFQVDVERTAGGETADTWLVSGKLNYLF